MVVLLLPFVCLCTQIRKEQSPFLLVRSILSIFSVSPLPLLLLANWILTHVQSPALGGGRGQKKAESWPKYLRGPFSVLFCASLKYSTFSSKLAVLPLVWTRKGKHYCQIRRNATSLLDFLYFRLREYTKSDVWNFAPLTCSFRILQWRSQDIFGCPCSPLDKLKGLLGKRKRDNRWCERTSRTYFASVQLLSLFHDVNAEQESASGDNKLVFFVPKERSRVVCLHTTPYFLTATVSKYLQRGSYAERDFAATTYSLHNRPSWIRSLAIKEMDFQRSLEEFDLPSSTHNSCEIGRLLTLLDPCKSRRLFFPIKSLKGIYSHMPSSDHMVIAGAMSYTCAPKFPEKEI